MRTLVERLNRMHRPAPVEALYRIERPNIVEDESGVQKWLQGHEDGGWITVDEKKRREMARRFLYAAYARARGLFSDEVRSGR